jgi:hypothetical protein
MAERTLRDGEPSKNVFDLRPPKREKPVDLGNMPKGMTISDYIEQDNVHHAEYMQSPEYKQYLGRIEAWSLANFYGTQRKTMEAATRPPMNYETWLAHSLERSKRVREIFKKKPLKQSEFATRFDPMKED